MFVNNQHQQEEASATVKNQFFANICQCSQCYTHKYRKKRTEAVCTKMRTSRESMPKKCGALLCFYLFFGVFKGDKY